MQVIKLITINILQLTGLLIYIITLPLAMLNSYIYASLIAKHDKQAKLKRAKKLKAKQLSKELKANNTKALTSVNLKYEV